MKPFSPNAAGGPRPPSRELRRLVDGLLAETLTRRDFARLEELLEGDPSAREYYLEVVGGESLLSLSLPLASPVGKTGAPARPVPSMPRRLAFAATIAAAAGLAVAIAVLMWPAGERPAPLADDAPVPRVDLSPRADIPPVVVTGEVGAVWSEGLEEVAVGDEVPGRTIAIEGGVLEVTYRNGVSLLIEGPARYHVAGANAGRLDYGNLVAEVPPGAEGFTIDYGSDRLVDHGTKFGLRMPRGEGAAEVAVFSGEVEVFPGAGERSAQLFRGHAVRRAPEEETGLRSIPLDRSLYVCELPSREFPWKMPPERDLRDEVAMEFDVTPLIQRPCGYRVLFKYMFGQYACFFRDVELRVDGELVAADRHEGRTGYATGTYDNVFVLDLPPARFRSGRWTLHATASNNIRRSDTQPSNTQGIMLFDEVREDIGFPEDFIGNWEFLHDGHLFSREVRADGSSVSKLEGRPFIHGQWKVRGGVLEIFYPSVDITEEHILRDRNTLIFSNRPFRNARRVDEG